MTLITGTAGPQIPIVFVLMSLRTARWYLLDHSMHPARAFEVNSPAASQKVLIATQGSAFKDSIVAGVVAHLRERQVYIKESTPSHRPRR